MGDPRGYYPGMTKSVSTYPKVEKTVVKTVSKPKGSPAQLAARAKFTAMAKSKKK